MIFTFDVNEQTLTRTDEFIAVTDSVEYLTAKFNFVSDDWNDTIKSAIFESAGVPYVVLLDDNNSCLVPFETLIRGDKDFINLKISVFGVRKLYRITSNPKTIRINASGYTPGKTPADPTPDVYADILNKYRELLEYKHSHENKDVLDNFGIDNDKLVYNGKPIGGSERKTKTVETGENTYITDVYDDNQGVRIMSYANDIPPGLEVKSIELYTDETGWLDIRDMATLDGSTNYIINIHKTYDDITTGFVCFGSLISLNGYVNPVVSYVQTASITNARITYYVNE